MNTDERIQWFVDFLGRTFGPTRREDYTESPRPHRKQPLVKLAWKRDLTSSIGQYFLPDPGQAIACDRIADVQVAPFHIWLEFGPDGGDPQWHIDLSGPVDIHLAADLNVEVTNH